MWADVLSLISLCAMIFIDDRIGSKELHPFIPKSKLVHLEYADVAFVGQGPNSKQVSIGIERKRIGDLVSSMRSGRLSGYQLIGLQQYDYVYLIVEGVWQINSRTGLLETRRGKAWQPHPSRMTGAELFGYLNTLSILCNISVAYTKSKHSSADLLIAIHSWWQRKWNSHTSHLRFVKKDWKSAMKASRAPVHIKAPPDIAKVINVLVPGIGYKKGLKIAEHFNSLAELVWADEQTLCAVPGIGKKLAQTIKDKILNR